MPTLRTIIRNRAAICVGLYHHFLSNGSFGTMLSFRSTVSWFLMMMVFSSTTLYFSLYSLPSLVRACTLSRLLFLPCFTVTVVSGCKVISRW